MNKPNCKIRNALVIGAILAGTGSVNASAQGNLMIYPRSGQSPQQQQQDQYQCNTWAVQQSGFNPASPPAQSSGSDRSATRKETLKGGARGAAAGAAIGAIAGDAGTGAAIGATAGGLKRRFQEKDRQTQSATASPPGLDNYNRAMASCLEALGYSVK
ncbi:MAG: glycine zipper family protein [Methylobacter sp.]|jgi:hypothetical protein